MQHRKLISAMAFSLVTAVAVPYAISATSASAASGGLNSHGPTGAASSVCQTTITKGAANTLETFCVAANGNLVQLAWRGVEQIREGNFTEGYVVCVGGVVKGYDLADFGESGFQAPVKTQPNGANTLPLTITRKTTDNSLQLTQTYSAGLDSVTVASSLKNLTGATIHAVKYFRWSDLDAGGQFTNAWTRSPDAVSATVDGTTGTLLGTATYGSLRTVSVMSIIDTTTCAPASDATPVTEDGVGILGYDMANLPTGTTKSANVVYRRI